MQSKEITLIYCNTRYNVAGIFMNPLGKENYESFRTMLGVAKKNFSI